MGSGASESRSRKSTDWAPSSNTLKILKCRCAKNSISVVCSHSFAKAADHPLPTASTVSTGNCPNIVRVPMVGTLSEASLLSSCFEAASLVDRDLKTRRGFLRHQIGESLYMFRRLASSLSRGTQCAFRSFCSQALSSTKRTYAENTKCT
jgi:hypothetical protein